LDWNDDSSPEDFELYPDGQPDPQPEPEAEPINKTLDHKPIHIRHVSLGKDLFTQKFVILLATEHARNSKIREILSLQPENAEHIQTEIEQQLRVYRQLLSNN